MKNGMRIIDADAHVRDFDEHYRSLLPEFYKKRPLFPHDNWDRRLGRKLGRDPTEPAHHARDMELEGIDLMVLYPTSGLFMGYVREPDLAVALCRAYNTFISDYCKGAPDRLKGVAILPMQDPKEAVKELRRAADELGLVGAMIPAYVYGKNLANQEFYPLYEEAQRLGIPIAAHATGSEPVGLDRFDNFLSVHTVSHSFDQMLACVSMIFGGIPELFPSLKLAFLEAGIGWVPYWMDRMDAEYEKRAHDAPILKAKPSQYMTSGRIYYSCETEESSLPFAIDRLGEDVILYASDYPHWDSDFPHTVSTLLERGDVADRAKRKILWDNPRAFYRLT